MLVAECVCVLEDVVSRGGGQSASDDTMHLAPTPQCLCDLDTQRGRGVNRGKTGARFWICVCVCVCTQL